jgi:hypothetical protein
VPLALAVQNTLLLKTFASEVVLVDIKEGFAEGQGNGPYADCIPKWF